MYDGFDWNGNGHRDAGDSYMDYEIMNDKGGGGGGHGSGGGSCAAAYGPGRHFPGICPKTDRCPTFQ